MMTQQKRSLASGEHRESFPSLALKRHKVDLSISTKEKKENFGERIATLQQLVSPYGKTDTASVLLEAMDYIRFLHDQVKLLSAPYLESASAIKAHQDLLEKYNLGRRGLCLVPISSTKTVARTNGADIWAPIKPISPTS